MGVQRISDAIGRHWLRWECDCHGCDAVAETIPPGFRDPPGPAPPSGWTKRIESSWVVVSCPACAGDRADRVADELLAAAAFY